eukprot:1589008-Pleurochrysis_carterae.AAC.2
MVPMCTRPCRAWTGHACARTRIQSTHAYPVHARVSSPRPARRACFLPPERVGCGRRTFCHSSLPRRAGRRRSSCCSSICKRRTCRSTANGHAAVTRHATRAPLSCLRLRTAHR